MTIKGLSLTQPWATLVAIGAKQIETRSWSTSYRGWLLIQAAKSFPAAAQNLCRQEPFAASLARGGYLQPKELPLGGIVAMVRLEHVFTTETMTFGGQLTEQERTFGDYSPNRFAWMLKDLYRFEPQIPCKGALSLWEVHATVLATIAEELAVVNG